MDAQDLVMMIASANGGRIEGRTVVQKLAYFANLRLGISGIRYADHFYGPFSREVALALEGLLGLLFMQETVRATPIESYTYDLTDDGRIIASDLVAQHPGELGTISGIVAACKSHCNLQVNPLACAAKVHYITAGTSAGGPATAQDIKEMAEGFGWNMADSDIDNGTALLESLSLVSV